MAAGAAASSSVTSPAARAFRTQLAGPKPATTQRSPATSITSTGVEYEASGLAARHREDVAVGRAKAEPGHQPEHAVDQPSTEVQAMRLRHPLVVWTRLDRCHAFVLTQHKVRLRPRRDNFVLTHH